MCPGALEEQGWEKGGGEIPGCQDARLPWVLACKDTALLLSDLYIKGFL